MSETLKRLKTSACQFWCTTYLEKSAITRRAMYSGRYLPACLIIHTGTLSVGSPFAARSSKSFSSTLASCPEVYAPLCRLLFGICVYDSRFRRMLFKQKNQRTLFVSIFLPAAYPNVYATHIQGLSLILRLGQNFSSVLILFLLFHTRIIFHYRCCV